ncbi:MAG: VWA domain-containing protein [Planctomycetota bacterium]|jgi:hypothetical protein
MSGWLKALLGIEESEIPEGAATSFEFANLPHGTTALLVFLVVLALLAGVFWIYRREGNAPKGAKITLGILRGLVLLAAVLLILEPVLSVDQVDEVDKGTILLLDDSLSMTTRDRYQDPVLRARIANALEETDPARYRRFELVNIALGRGGMAERLALQNELYAFRFASAAVPHANLMRGVRHPGPVLPLDPTSKEDQKRSAAGTNLAGAIRQSVERVGSDRVAAVVLVTDGRSTLGPPPEDIALYLRNKDLKLHTVAVGEDEPPRNLRAIALAGPDRVYRDDPVAFEARVSGRGFGGALVEFERRYTDGSDDWERIGTESVVFPAGDRPLTLKFRDRPPRVGSVEYRIKMEGHPDEVTHRDNAKSFITRVVEEKARVLLISGGPAHEYYAVKNVLLRDGTVTLACYLQSADPEFPQDGNEISLRELPGDEKELFEYGVVILHDPDGDRFPPGFSALLRKFVGEHGGGLCFIAGNKHTLHLLRQARGEESLAGILPVVLDLDRADTPGMGIGLGLYFSTPWRMAPTPAAFSHPVTRFHGDARLAGELIWSRLPQFYWFFPVLKAKPGAVVLAHHDDYREAVEPYGPRPILAVHRYGGGNVMFLAADETHRWRSVAEKIFDRFWVQASRFLLEGRLAGARRRFRVYCDKEVVDQGDAVQVTVEAFSENYEPYDGDRVTLRITGPEELEEEVELLPLPGKEGQFVGALTYADLGDYAIRPDKRFLPEKAEDTPAASFMIIWPDREMGDVRTDRALLMQLAARTGGVGVGLEEFHRVLEPRLIPPSRERVVTQGRPVPLWDTWTTIIVILALLCAEWILRKKFRMV